MSHWALPIATTILFVQVISSERFKRILDGLRTRREDLEVDWSTYEKAEEALRNKQTNE